MKNLIKSFEMLTAFAAACPQGFTIDSQTFAPIKSGYAVAVADTQNSFGNAGAARVVAYAAKHDNINALGGWFNSDNNQYYFEAVVIFEEQTAANEFARLNNQIAYFDLTNGKEIIL